MAGQYSRRLRRSQIVTTFGPGAIVDLPDESVMLAGIDWWSRNPEDVIREPILRDLLNVDEFRAPPVAADWGQKTEKFVPVVLFPEWLICPVCHRLARYDTITGGITPGRAIKCVDCKRRLFPARLIMACPKGHVDDFPWNWWVHEARGKVCTGRSALKITSMGKTASLGDLIVRCETCKESRSLSGAMVPDNFKDLTCSGKLPWLRREDECDVKPPTPLQRGASNVYFSVLASSISIPPWSKSAPLIQKLEGKLETFRELPAENWRVTIEAMKLPEKLMVDTDEIIDAIRTGLQEDDVKIDIESEQELRYLECQALRIEHGAESRFDEFQTRKGVIHPGISDYVTSVMYVDRLREVRALRGFTRVAPPDPSNIFQVKIAPISKYANPYWLPAIEVRGEGLYIELNEKRLTSWEKNPIVIARASRIQQMYEDMCARRNWTPERTITPRFLLTHSLSHILIKYMALESGYTSASIRERLYVFDDTEIDVGSLASSGILIYTSTVDSEGSLGGLVRQGDTERFASTIIGAVNDAAWCASDPLCIENEGLATGMMNLAACHACLLVSETSCEEYNRFLDRVMLVGTLSEPDIGYFSGIQG